jgi:hypothetical protein
MNFKLIFFAFAMVLISPIKAALIYDISQLPMMYQIAIKQQTSGTVPPPQGANICLSSSDARLA